MQVEQVAAEGLKREFKVTVPAGEIEQRVRTRLEKLAKTVRLPGFREDVLSLMKSADLFVMSSVTEGLGSAVLDAMAMGHAVVGTRAGGIPVFERSMDRHDIYTAEECFLTGTAAEIIPVVKCDGRPIGNGKPGPIFRQLRERFQAYVKA